MRSHFRFVLHSVAVSVAIGLGCAPASDGHAHTATSHGAAASSELEPTSQTVFGERVLVYLEHARVVRGERVRFLAHLSVLATGEPVRSGTVRLEIGGATLTADAPKREGLFVPEGSVTEPGRHAAKLVVQSDQGEETLELAPIVAHVSIEEARRTAEEEAASAPANTIPFLMEQQWRVRLLLAEAAPAQLAERLVLPATLAYPDGAQVVVSPPVAGRLFAPEARTLPRSGERVDAGQILGWVEAPLSAPDLAQMQALQLELDLKALDVEQALAGAEARLTFAERERERVAKLRGEVLSTQQELDAAERDLVLARTALAAARTTQESLARIRKERAARPDSSGSGTRLALTAPIAGIVFTSGHVAGEFVQTAQELFRIVDTARLWVDGRVSEFDLARFEGIPAARLKLAALTARPIELAADPDRALFVSPDVDPSSRTVAIRYEVDNADRALRPGMLGELELALKRVDAPVTVPAEAVQMEQGLACVYVMLEGEAFQRREIELGVRDGEHVEVRRGLTAGERVATHGAYLVRLAALSPASFGAGHQH